MTLASSEIFLFCPAAASCTALTRSAIWLSVCLKRFTFSISTDKHTQSQRANNSPYPKLVHPILGRVQVQQVHLLGTQTDRCVRSFAGCHAAFPIVLWLLLYSNTSLKCVSFGLVWWLVLAAVEFKVELIVKTCKERGFRGTGDHWLALREWRCAVLQTV